MERVGNAQPGLLAQRARTRRGSQRLLEYAAKGDVHDKRLWTAVAKATGAAGNSTALVGSYEQVAESLREYVDLGVGTLLIRGFDPLEDAKDYGHAHRPGARRPPATRRWTSRMRPEAHDDDRHPRPRCRATRTRFPTPDLDALPDLTIALARGAAEANDRTAELPGRRDPARPRRRPADRDGRPPVRRSRPRARPDDPDPACARQGRPVGGADLRLDAVHPCRPGGVGRLAGSGVPGAAQRQRDSADAGQRPAGRAGARHPEPRWPAGHDRSAPRRLVAA